MNRIYVARKYWINKHEDKCYYEEGAFSSYNEAYRFIKEISIEDDDFLSEIVSYVVDDYKPWLKEQKWTFDHKGVLLIEQTEDIDEEETIVYLPPEIYTGKFKVGDIVFSRAYPWNKHSASGRDVIGVVYWRPEPLEEWVAAGKDEKEWESKYTIYYIGEDGYMDHNHFPEISLELYDKEILEKFEFLKVLRNHLLGIKRIRFDLLPNLLSSRIFVKKVRTLLKEADYEEAIWEKEESS